MKNFLSILVVFAIATTISFATIINDNSGSTKVGNGTFQATVLTPLSIDSPSADDLGEFVESATPYSVTNAITFTVTGENNHDYYFKTEVNNTAPSVATFAGSWDQDYLSNNVKTLSATGTSTHTYTLSSLTAIASGSADLELTVTVSYNNDI